MVVGGVEELDKMVVGLKTKRLKRKLRGSAEPTKQRSWLLNIPTKVHFQACQVSTAAQGSVAQKGDVETWQA